MVEILIVGKLLTNNSSIKFCSNGYPASPASRMNSDVTRVKWTSKSMCYNGEAVIVTLEYLYIPKKMSKFEMNTRCFLNGSLYIAPCLINKPIFS